jgi:anti-sigma28 factor (negative regulator of flagellin synthesis)
MKAIGRNQAAVAYQTGPDPDASALPLSPEHSNSSSSGTYFRAVRPTEAEAAAVSRGETVIDGGKVKRLTGAVGAGLWQLDPGLVAERMIDDAE